MEAYIAEPASCNVVDSAVCRESYGALQGKVYERKIDLRTCMFVVHSSETCTCAFSGERDHGAPHLGSREHRLGNAGTRGQERDASQESQDIPEPHSGQRRFFSRLRFIHLSS